MRATANARAVFDLVGARQRLWGTMVALALLGVGVASAGAGVQRWWVLVLLVPLAEEAVFRAGLQEALLRRGSTPLAGNVLTALAFGLAHVAVWGDVAAFAVTAPALLIGSVYGRWRRLRFCVALHAAMNALWLARSLMGPAWNIGF